MRELIDTKKMNQLPILIVTLLYSLHLVKSVSLHLSTGNSDANGNGRSTLALYQAPPTYKEPGKPRLNSIIIKSKPYIVNDSTMHLNPSDQEIENSKTWRREAVVATHTITNNVQEKNEEEMMTTQPTTVPDIATIPQYTIDCNDEKQTCSETISVIETTTAAPTFKPYSQEELEKYLYQATMSSIPKSNSDDKPTNKLASIYIEDETVNVLETTPNPSLINSETQDKSKSWNLVNSQIHKHPYDDRNGWVSLEPIPWSSSQIQKWEPNPHTRPQIPSWPEQHQPWGSKPPHSSRPSQDYSRPPWHKPVYDYSRPTVQDNYHKPSSTWNYNQDSSSNGPTYQVGSWGSTSDIVTDGRPGYFPSDKPPWQEQSAASYNRPTQVVYHKPGSNYNINDRPQHQSQHQHGPSDSDGQWVLLSSTKGYSVPQPQRQRSFQRSLRMEDLATIGTSSTPAKSKIQAQPSMKSHRTVRLTVLPPLNTTNTTISHGGLIEVEQTHQTVDEAHREHLAKMMNLWKDEQRGHQQHVENKENSTRNGELSPKAEKRVSSMKIITGKPLQSTTNSRNNAVLAAVGAGMIPATMAMLLPMVLGRKRKRRDAMEDLIQPSIDIPSSLRLPKDNEDNSKRIKRKPIKKLNLRKKTEVVYY